MSQEKHKIYMTDVKDSVCVCQSLSETQSYRHDQPGVLQGAVNCKAIHPEAIKSE